MYCATCDRWEHSDIGLDTETCILCGGYLCQSDDDQCDCQNPEPESGVALVSEDCPIHGRSS